MAKSYAALKADFVEHLQHEAFDYKSSINKSVDGFFAANTKGSKTMAAPKSPRVLISLNHLRSLDPTLVNQMMRNPMPYIRALRDAVNDLAEEDSDKFKASEAKVEVGFEGSFGQLHVSPRGLRSSCLRSLVCVEGIVTKCSAVRPKVTKSVHYCEKTGQTTDKIYRDATSLELGLPRIDRDGTEMQDTILSITNAVYPTKDKENNPLETEYGLCQYEDFQTITIQEMPERAPMGQLPRSVDVIVSNDLVDQVKPGDRIQTMGVFRALGSNATNETSGIFRTVVVANNMRVLGQDVATLKLDADDIKAIKAVGKRNDVLKVLARSIAPSIYGHEHIKKALALQLLGGCEKNLENGTHIRGDINILMVGDPSTAKSQVLRTALQIAPLAISTTGRGSSGVGLTAAVTSDEETGDRRLEAGAMVLADRGLVCIDEFDKMSEADRVAIHEVMEQQTVTIAKAGLHASLNARCSVLAAANPVYGQYDKNRRPQDNIGLPDSLLSRFDLLFVVLDQLDPANDRRISAHVLKGHRYRKPGTDMAPEPLQSVAAESDDEDDDEKKTVVWQRSHHSTQSSQMDEGGGENGTGDDHESDVLSQDFLRKYIFYAKRKCKPEMTEESREYIANRYAEMRSKQDDKTLPVTARSLETIIRLSSAHSKCRLSTTVEVSDCEAAMDILSFALYHEEDSEKKRKAEKALEDSEQDGEQDSERESQRQKLSEEEEPSAPINPPPVPSAPLVDPYDLFVSTLESILTRNEGQADVSEIVDETGLDSDKVADFLAKLSEENKVMVDADSDTVIRL
ncbi:hypothetical protein TrVE_jg9723 [Triparma verrucosa]|uniref:DNA replication licensing factor MCM3 n=2 Tax=Triparma TaxID=722752 RepID=A0A9W7EGI2_9STRA|nr:hypothetical protein TrST_g10611 [Triparma strigata]GMI02992.1 hypothetical protein TrVE_jg9723 [Triparma verrucosa]